MRRSGCSSLDLCAVASGTLDGFYESGIGRWDIAAGAAIAELAGATVVELPSPSLSNPLLMVAHAVLLEALVAMLVEARPALDARASAARACSPPWFR
jgi:myo-inositol-1(or 4)-monophosphatase